MENLDVVFQALGECEARFAIALPEPRPTDIFRRGDEHRADLGITRGSLGEMDAGAVDHNPDTIGAPAVDLAADAIAEAMAFPIEREPARPLACRKLRGGEGDVVLRIGQGRAGDVAMGAKAMRPGSLAARARAMTLSLPAPEGPMTKKNAPGVMPAIRPSHPAGRTSAQRLPPRERGSRGARP